MRHIIFVIASTLVCCSLAAAYEPQIDPSAYLSDRTADGEWWNKPYLAAFDKTLLRRAMSPISVAGNQFVDADGRVVVFRGVNIADPDKLAKNGRWNKQYFAEARRWGANILRIPVHPVAWSSRGERGYIMLLDDAVQWANELGMYLIIDWHSIGNLSSGMYQHPMYDTTLQQTLQFWQTIATRYRGITTIAFYELFNEPTTAGGKFGKLSWAEWKNINEAIIDMIYAHDDAVIPLVAGFNWAYDLSAARGNLIDRDGVAYVAHPYPQKAKVEPQQAQWDQKFGFIAEHAPLIATEIGWMKEGERGAHVPVINNDGSYGPKIIDYLDGLGASWVAWVFDPDWTPNLFTSWDYIPTEQGAFFKQVMLKENQ